MAEGGYQLVALVLRQLGAPIVSPGDLAAAWHEPAARRLLEWVRDNVSLENVLPQTAPIQEGGYPAPALRTMDVGQHAAELTHEQHRLRQLEAQISTLQVHKKELHQQAVEIDAHLQRERFVAAEAVSRRERRQQRILEQHTTVIQRGLELLPNSAPTNPGLCSCAQATLAELSNLETRFRCALTAYVKKQFHEGFLSLAASDEQPCELLDLSQPYDWHPPSGTPRQVHEEHRRELERMREVDRLCLSQIIEAQVAVARATAAYDTLLHQTATANSLLPSAAVLR